MIDSSFFGKLHFFGLVKIKTHSDLNDKQKDDSFSRRFVFSFFVKFEVI